MQEPKLEQVLSAVAILELSHWTCDQLVITGDTCETPAKFSHSPSCVRIRLVIFVGNLQPWNRIRLCWFMCWPRLGACPQRPRHCLRVLNCRFEHAARQVSEVHFDEEQMFKDSTKRSCCLVCCGTARGRQHGSELAGLTTGCGIIWRPSGNCLDLSGT